MSKNIKLSEEEAEQLWSEIESEGFGYWVQNYGYKDNKDEELSKLCKIARESLDKLEDYTNTIFEHYEIF